MMGQEKETSLECREACHKMLKLAAAKLGGPKHDSKKSSSEMSLILPAVGKLNK